MTLADRPAYNFFMSSSALLAVATKTDELPVMAYGTLSLSEFSVNPQMNFLSMLIFHDRLLVPSMDEKQAKNTILS